MKIYLPKLAAGLALCCCFLFSIITSAQTPGLIVRPAGGPYSSVLDPNTDGFTSPSTSGFITTDVGTGYSEIPYKIIPPFQLEPTADLMRGPSDGFTDLVRLTSNESGFYVYSTGGATPNLLFRMRVGDIVSGSKGYSVLIDADQLFGATGPYADPNYQPATTGSNGNPGFEFEVVLETNFRVAVYNVDGTSTPVLLASYPIASNSQTSLAISTVSNTPDYFYDFYVPLSALTGITATTPLRMSATTVMAPQAAIGGPKSDIFGVTGTDYMKAWESLISAQSSFTANDVTAAGLGINPTCTAAPTLNSPINAGTVTVSGTWVTADVSKPSATIRLYRVRAGVTTEVGSSLNTGNTWSVTGVLAVAGDKYYAKAQATGESSCLESNSILVSSCATRTSQTGFALSCATIRGLSGTRASGTTITIYTVTNTGYTVFATDNSGTNRITYPTATTWEYQGPNTQNGDPCGGGAADVTEGSYAITALATGQCASDYLYTCISGSGGSAITQTATPTITQTALYTGATTVSGTAVANATVRLFKDGALRATTTASASGTYTFTGLSLNLGEVMDVYAQSAGQCVSAKVSRTVTCFTNVPVINTTATGNLISGATSITGTSADPVGTTIRVYNGSNTLLATTTVQSGGIWSAAVSVTSGTSYYATAQNGTCGVSTASATVSALAATTICPTITGSYTETSTIVSGGFSNTPFSGTVRLYEDGAQIGSVTVTSATTWSITPAANLLYPGGVLTASTQAASSSENTTCANSVTIACAPPATPVILPATAVPFDATSKVKYTITNAQSGVLYTLENTSGVDQGVSVFGNGGTITLTSNAFLIAGTYNLKITALKLSRSSCATAATAVTAIIGDNDLDGIVDGIDGDDDNDGIPDTIENGGVSANGDADNDGVLNYRDADYCTLNSKGVCTKLDKDGDGIINQFDLDSDNDGIPDLVEAGGVDANGDGRVDYTGTFASNDSDGDGIINRYDASTGGVTIGSLDTDGDGVLNFFDLDSDNDGIPDVLEAGGIDANIDGKYDATTDTDGDGWADAIDGDLGNDGTAENSANVLVLTGPDNNYDGKPESYIRGDFDRDGKANPYDLDSDGDGILDVWEADLNQYDTNSNGMINSTDAGYADVNGDGWADVIDALVALNLTNTDGKGGPDYLDIDADDDGLTDNIEGQASAGYLPPLGIDVDNDGIDDRYDNNTTVIGGTTGNGIIPVNTDGTDLPDYRDTDTDNDGDPDRIEGNDLNANHRADDMPVSIPTTDTDGDGLLDFFETNVNSGPVVFIAGFGGTASSGKSTAQKTLTMATDRDWRNASFILSSYVALPVKFLSVTAAAQSNSVMVTWTVTDERNIKHYVVERSIDGGSFSRAGMVAYKAPETSINKYTFTDNSASGRRVYYRVRQVDEDGQFTLSTIVSVHMTTAVTKLVLYPNPIQAGTVAELTAAAAQQLILMVADAQGRIVIQQHVSVQKGRNRVMISGIQQLPAGTYLLTTIMDGTLQKRTFVRQ